MNLQSPAAAPTAAAAGPLNVTAFVCTNCARGGKIPSAVRGRPQPPTIDWPCAVKEVLIPCSGRLQPEHILRAFEAGADFVCVLACQDDNCHYLEGSKRAARRVEYLQGLLDEIGLGGKRLALLSLPGSAREDMAAGLPLAASGDSAQRAQQIQAVGRQVAQCIANLPPSPMHHAPPEEETEITPLDNTEEGDE